MAGKRSLAVVVAVVIILALGAFMLWHHAQKASAPAVAVATPPAPSATATAPAPETTPKAPPAAPAEPLPPLIPGSPLTDEKFAAVSAKIVTVAVGLKQDKDWEVNTMVYMSKVLDQAGITEKDFTDYAQALNRYPDRARAVAENIVSKAEKKLGYRITMDKMPMFKVSPERVRKIDKELQKKLK